jgi:hypothetical protein
MQRRNMAPLAVLLECCLLMGCNTETVRFPASPIQAEYLRTVLGKPPMKIHCVRLTLLNQHDRPIWFVLPYSGDKPLPENGTFPNENWKEQPFGGQQFEGKGGSAIEVCMYGGGGFTTFRLPAKGRLELDGYEIDGSKDISEIVVLEAEELKVNGKTPLERWLPYDTMCGEMVEVNERAQINWRNLDWNAEKLGSRQDYPKETVEIVQANGTHRWVVRF